jgi:2-keto-4-pentenoate hydratase
LSATAGPDLSPSVIRGLELQAVRMRERLAAGERRVGWKIGLNDPRVQRALGISAPVIGYLTSATVLPGGATHSLAGATRPAIEPEVAIHMGADGEIAALGAALEVIDVDMPFDDVAAILERDVFHRAAVLGPPVTGVADLAGRAARMTRSGGEDVHIDVAQAALDPTEVVRLVAGYLDAVGDKLRAGDAIIGGSLVTAVPLGEDERVELEIDGLGSVALEVLRQPRQSKSARSP